MKNQKKYQKGITLIALVITIIVLLILAGVTLSIVFNGGIINKSQTAVDKYTEEQAKEKLSLAIFNYKMGVITGEAGEGKKELSDYLAEIGGAITKETSDLYIIELDGYEFSVTKSNYEITSNGPVTGDSPSIVSIEKEPSADKKSATIKVTASAKNGGTLRVTIGGQEATLENGTYNLTVTKRGKYTVIVEESGLTRKAIEIVDITEEQIEVTKYTVTVSKGTNTGITKVEPETEQQVEEGKSVTISATVSSGYIFKEWTIASGAGTIENTTSATTTVKPTGNITIEATAGKQMATVTDGNNLTGSANGTINGKFSTYQNPVIPVGFKTSSEGASWSLSADGSYVTGWNDGLVIEDAETGGNQFVWVPVHNQVVVENGITIPAVPYTKWTSSKTLVNHTSCSDDTILSGTIDETAQITEYGGFYIARYEAGIPTDDGNLTTGLTTASAEARNKSGVPVSKKNQIPWNYIDYTTSKANAERMYSDNYVKSGLVTGTQWDTTMKWLENEPSSVNVQTNSRDWGNYGSSAITEITEYSNNYGASWISKTDSNAKGTTWLLKTGHTDFTKRKNIYDLAGNIWDWTSEIYESSNSVRRGGSFMDTGSDYPAAYRYYNSVDYDEYSVGFRCVLYVM